jgi:photosystem II stability/assembly factor-like uncharacterized protein
VGKIVLLSAIFFLVATFFSPSVYAAVTWEETQPAGNTIQDWTPVALSSDGQIMMSGVQNGRLYISKNGGDTWMETLPIDNDPEESDDHGWYPMSMSSNGQVIVVGVLNERLYLSVNGGDSWSETRPGGDANKAWYTLSMSSDGQTILAGDHAGRLYRSINTGSSWDEVRPVGNTDQQWRSTAVSDDGQIMYAGIDGTRLYRSTNGGDSWAEIQPAGDIDMQWSALALSSDSQTVLAANRNRLYRSTDGGDSWVEMQPGGDNELTWVFASVSANGDRMFVSEGNRLYYSNDRGNTWVETQPLGDTNQTWAGGAVSRDGTVLITNIYGGRVYLGANPLPVSPGLTAPSEASPPAQNCPAVPAGSPHLFQIDAAGSFVNLYFTGQSGISGYNINYGVTPSANQYGDHFSASSDWWVVGRTVSGLQPNTTYYFRVQSVNGCNAGGWSQVVSVKTKNKSSVLNQWFANLAK